jgi:hypothetical protein
MEKEAMDPLRNFWYEGGSSDAETVRSTVR